MCLNLYKTNYLLFFFLLTYYQLLLTTINSIQYRNSLLLLLIGIFNLFPLVLPLIKTIIIYLGCGGIVHDDKGSLTSPNYSTKDYPNNVECEWKVTLSPGFHAKINFINRFSLESSTGCVNDFIQVKTQCPHQKLVIS